MGFNIYIGNVSLNYVPGHHTMIIVICNCILHNINDYSASSTLSMGVQIQEGKWGEKANSTIFVFRRLFHELSFSSYMPCAHKKLCRVSC